MEKPRCRILSAGFQSRGSDGRWDRWCVVLLLRSPWPLWEWMRVAEGSGGNSASQDRDPRGSQGAICRDKGPRKLQLWENWVRWVLAANPRQGTSDPLIATAAAGRHPLRAASWGRPSAPQGSGLWATKSLRRTMTGRARGEGLALTSRSPALLLPQAAA